MNLFDNQVHVILHFILCHRWLGMLLAPLRAVVPTWETRDTQGSDYAYAMAIVEDPSRAITQLRNLARGHALSEGRTYITVQDIPMVIKVVFSTCSIERQTIFEILIENNGVLRTSQIVHYLNTTKPTALRTMTELKATGLVTMYDVNPAEYNSEKEICLKPEFSWFLSDNFAELRANNNGRCKEKYPHSHAILSNNHPKVVNIENTNEPCLYIGRSKRFGGPSKWANPYKIGTDGTREEVIAKYKEYLSNNKDLMLDIPELKGKVLGCHCAPEPCHGDILLSLANDGYNKNNDIALGGQNSLHYIYICYYCDFQTNNNNDYERHVVNTHDRPAYPNKAEIEKSGLKAQGKAWED